MKSQKSILVFISLPLLCLSLSLHAAQRGKPKVRCNDTLSAVADPKWDRDLSERVSDFLNAHSESSHVLSRNSLGLVSPYVVMSPDLAEAYYRDLAPETAAIVYVPGDHYHRGRKQKSLMVGHTGIRVGTSYYHVWPWGRRGLNLHQEPSAFLHHFRSNRIGEFVIDTTKGEREAMIESYNTLAERLGSPEEGQLPYSVFGPNCQTAMCDALATAKIRHVKHPWKLDPALTYLIAKRTGRMRMHVVFPPTQPMSIGGSPEMQETAIRLIWGNTASRLGTLYPAFLRYNLEQATGMRLPRLNR